MIYSRCKVPESTNKKFSNAKLFCKHVHNFFIATILVLKEAAEKEECGLIVNLSVKYVASALAFQKLFFHCNWTRYLVLNSEKMILCFLFAQDCGNKHCTGHMVRSS